LNAYFIFDNEKPNSAVPAAGRTADSLDFCQALKLGKSNAQ